MVGIIGTVDRPVDEKQLDKDARRTLKKNGIKDPSGMDVDMEPLGMTGGRSPTGPKTQHVLWALHAACGTLLLWFYSIFQTSERNMGS